MMKKNHLFAGIIVGAIAPIIACLFAEHTVLHERFADKPLTLYMIAGTVNLLLLRYFYKKDASQTAGGVIAITFMGIILLLVFKENITIF
ncbi:hypothetical protein H8S90_25370 [Olivibacter sp. SDN3]|uniref:hypothetical protein n=1 Tax=Olivibacter sp. SDN3 TaxID=2764720 RepID=UPI001650D996|nr:hypothetical protein [Olivibacter sp. SDN3]QNL49975.1 hypothetical protein H8S90_25370 [Olivibacter sp. SDN3]